MQNTLSELDELKRLTDEETAIARESLVLRLKRSPNGLDRTLARTVPLGVAYHHGGA
jgi:replicative superfamily II helicase